MSDTEQLRRVLAYNRAVYFRFLRWLARRSWRFAVADRGTAQGSLRNTMVHVLHVHEIWCGYIVPGRLAELDRRGHRFEDLRSWRAIRHYAEQVFDDIDRRLRRLRAPELDRRVRAPWMPGRYSVRDAYWQASFEQAHHLGEVIAVLWQVDRRPPDMTWIDVGRGGR